MTLRRRRLPAGRQSAPSPPSPCSALERSSLSSTRARGAYTSASLLRASARVGASGLLVLCGCGGRAVPAHTHVFFRKGLFLISSWSEHVLSYLMCTAPGPSAFLSQGRCHRALDKQHQNCCDDPCAHTLAPACAFPVSPACRPGTQCRGALLRTPPWTDTDSQGAFSCGCPVL